VIIRTFGTRFKWLGWHCFSVGIHIDLIGPYLDIHFPGGWATIGWMYFDMRRMAGSHYPTPAYEKAQLLIWPRRRWWKFWQTMPPC